MLFIFQKWIVFNPENQKNSLKISPMIIKNK